MEEKKSTSKKKGWTFALGLAAGIILYKVIFEGLWPMLAG
jgi:hypothetical protein